MVLKLREKSMKNLQDMAFLAKSLIFLQNPATRTNISKMHLFPSKMSVKSVKSGQLTPKMSQIEAFIFIFDFQVLKMYLYIKNSKNGPEVTENLEILAKWAKNRVVFQL